MYIVTRVVCKVYKDLWKTYADDEPDSGILMLQSLEQAFVQEIMEKWRVKSLMSCQA